MGYPPQGLNPRSRPATVVVAASDASVSSKAGADYICVPPDSLVFANPSVRPISEVTLGEKVLSHSGYREVTGIFKRPYAGKLIEIKAFGGETFRLTPNHPVYAIQDTLAKDGYCLRAQTHHRIRKLALNYSPCWVRADGLKKGDVVLLRFPSEEKPMQELDLRHYLTKPYVEKDGVLYGIGRNQTGKVQRNPKAHQIPKAIPISDDFLKLAGLYLAEGCAANSVICLYFGKHETELINKTKQLFSKVFGLEAHVQLMQTSARVYVNSVLLANLFKNLFGNKAEEKHLPEWALYLPHNKQRVLLDAYSEGDGCKDSKQERFTTVSRQLAYQIRQILFRLRRPNNISRKPASEYEIRDRRGPTKEKFDVYASFSANRSFIGDQFAYLSIRDISEAPYEGEVYNLQVAGANSYTIAGATLHNCDGTADQVEIQAALDALPAAGGKVQLSEGVFYLSAAIRRPNGKSLTLEGMGAGFPTAGVWGTWGATPITCLRLADGANCNILDVDETVGGTIAAGGMLFLNNMLLDGNAANQTATSYGVVVGATKQVSEVGLFRVYFYSIRDDAIRIVSNSHFWLSEAIFEFGTGNCINLVTGINDIHIADVLVYQGTRFLQSTCSGASEIFIDNCVVTDLTEHAIYMEAGAWGVWITNCSFRSNGSSAGTWATIYLNDCDQVFIQNCMSSPGANGKYFAYLLDCMDCQIKGGRVASHYRGAVVLESCTRCHVEDVVLTNNCQDANNTYDVIFLTDDGLHFTTRCLVLGNTITETAANKARRGISENAVSDDYNRILGNSVQGAVTAAINRQGANTEIGHNLEA